MFALQVANHDSYWGGPPRDFERNRLRTFLKALLLLPAVALFLMPSFKIGRLTFRAPEFQIPSSAKQGSVFTLPVEEEFESVKLEGHTLPEIKSKTPMYLAAVNTSSPIMDLVLTYKAPETHLSLKSLMPKFEHPTYSVYTKQIKVERLSAAEEAQAIARENEKSKDDHSRQMSSIPTDPKVFSRNDGVISATCWQNPVLEEIPQLGVRQGRRPGPRMATLSAAGSGEVVQIGITNGVGTEKSVVIYHGGGVFSRYHGVKDYRVRRGDRIQAGQAIAVVDAGTVKKPAAPRWDLHLGDTELNRESFLALSSQLCDSK
jgi:Peptidase family M23